MNEFTYEQINQIRKLLEDVEEGKAVSLLKAIKDNPALSTLALTVTFAMGTITGYFSF